ncbi:MAG: universal stress protein [Planctomycetes bacterium]|nr:universal stress protein [Planctomycetota bacterium]
MPNVITLHVDASKYTLNAASVACSIARKYGSVLHGIAFVDVDAISAGERGAGIGAIGFLDRVVDANIEKAKDRADGGLRKFRESCQRRMVNHRASIMFEVANEGLAREGQTSDLIITGFRSAPFVGTVDDDTEVLSQLLRAQTCPILAIPKNCTDVENVIFSYDGSVKAAKALRSFAHNFLHGPNVDIKVSVITMNKDSATAKQISGAAARFLESYGIVPEILILEGNVASALIALAKSKAHPMIVLGTHSRSAITEFLFGSTASKLVESEVCPLFFYG